MISFAWQNRLKNQAEERRALGRTRSIQPASGLDFCSNDYLGLRGDPRLAEAAAEAARAFGAGAGAARLLRGDSPLHQELEATLAQWKGTEACLLFNTGFQANATLLPALLGRGDAVFSDALNHASLVDGCRLARAGGARVGIYRHRDAGHLDSQLSAWRAEGPRSCFCLCLFPPAAAAAVSPRPGLVGRRRRRIRRGFVFSDGRGRYQGLFHRRAAAAASARVPRGGGGDDGAAPSLPLCRGRLPGPFVRRCSSSSRAGLLLCLPLALARDEGEERAHPRVPEQGRPRRRRRRQQRHEQRQRQPRARRAGRLEGEEGRLPDPGRELGLPGRQRVRLGRRREGCGGRRRWRRSGRSSAKRRRQRRRDNDREQPFPFPRKERGSSAPALLCRRGGQEVAQPAAAAGRRRGEGCCCFSGAAAAAIAPAAALGREK